MPGRPDAYCVSHDEIVNGKRIDGGGVLWDNRSVMPQANADYHMSVRRYLDRLMLKGEVPV